MNISNCRPFRKPYRRILLLLVLACLLTTPVMAQQNSGNDPQSTPDNGKTLIERTKTGDDAPELTVKATIAIDKGLQYLLTVQKPDGSWDNGAGNHAVCSTSLALMAFMSKAQFPGAGPYAAQLDRGNDWLLAQSYHNLGMAYADKQDWASANEKYEQTLELARKVGIGQLIATTYLNKAELYLALSDVSQAAATCGKWLI